MAMKYTVSCPACLATLTLKSRASLGKRRNCPRCGQTFVLGADDADVDESDSTFPTMSGRITREARPTKKSRISNRNIALICIGIVMASGLSVGAYSLSRRGDVSPETEGELAANSTEPTPAAAFDQSRAQPPEQPNVPQPSKEPQPVSQPVAETNNLSEQSLPTPTLPANPQPPPTTQEPVAPSQPAPRSAPSNSTAPTSAANWTRFRGPNGTGVSNVTGLPIEWSDNKNIRWKTPLPGPGLSSPVVWKNNVYVTCFTGYDWPKEHSGKKRTGDLERHLICVDLQTGRIKWKKTDPAENYKRDMDLADSNQWQLVAHGFASNTPTCDARGVYAFFAADGLFAYTHDGKPRWATSCGAGYDRTGSASSPVAVGNLVYVSAHIESHTFYAINADTGQIVWKLPYHGGYPTPVMHQREEHTELLVNGEKGALTALDSQTGAKLWEVQRATPGKPSFVQGGGKIFSVDNAGKIFAFKADRSLQWELAGGTYFGTPIYHNNHLFYQGGGVFRCVDVESGQFLERKRLPDGGACFASPVMADGRLYCVSREKGVYVIEAKPSLNLLAHNRINGDESFFDATPAITSEGIILRSNRFLYCIGKK